MAGSLVVRLPGEKVTGPNMKGNSCEKEDLPFFFIQLTLVRREDQ